MNFRTYAVIATLKNCQSLAQVHYNEKVTNGAALIRVLSYSSQCVIVSKSHNHSMNFCGCFLYWILCKFTRILFHLILHEIFNFHHQKTFWVLSSIVLTHSCIQQEFLKLQLIDEFPVLAGTTPYVLILPTHVLLFSPFFGSVPHLEMEFFVSYFKLTQKFNVLMWFSFVRNILSSIHHVHNIQLSFNLEQFPFFASFEDHMFSKYSTGWRLHISNQVNIKKYVNFAHRILLITEIKVDTVTATKCSIKALLIHVVYNTQARTLHCDVWDAHVEIDGCTVELWHCFLLHILMD